jgi:transposase InsO family protein
MAWQTRSLMDLKREFVELALQPGANRRELCRRFGISPKSAYALLARYQEEGWACLTPRSSRPHSSPLRSSASVEEAVVQLRQQHPCWGGRKIARVLVNAGLAGASPLPSSTVTAILHRHGLISAQASQAAMPWQRFEHEVPNALWQMDFKGFFETPGGRCHPLTLLDDHSRFNLTLSACARPDTPSVQTHLQRVFEHYGLPVRINADNGGPWGSPRAAQAHSLSDLSIWLIRLGIRVSHSAPYHPQTNGKLERFHRSLKAEVLNGRSFASLELAQQAFDRWRSVYNHERPHDALGLQTPIQRYALSPRQFPSTLQPIEYSPDDTVIEVGWNGFIKFKGLRLHLSSSLHRLPIAMRPDTQHEGCYDAYFCHQQLMHLDLNKLGKP